MEAFFLRSSYEQRIRFLDKLCHWFLASQWSYENHLLKSDSIFLRKPLEAGLWSMDFFRV